MRKSKRKFKGVSRIDQPEKHTHGWYVRVSLNGTVNSKFFADEKNGGADKALKKAIRFRNKLERELGIPRTDRRIVTNSPRNTTGVVGVQKTVKMRRNSDGKAVYYNVYEVTWTPEPGVIRRTTVSIDLHGDDKAFMIAYKIRKKKEREIYGKTIQIE